MGKNDSPLYGGAQRVRYFNKERSWFQFNARVLHQAQDPSVPLIERLRFLSIASSNLDEFFMKNIGHLKRLIGAGAGEVGADRADPRALCRELRQKTLEFNSRRFGILQNILPRLEREGIFVLGWHDLKTSEKDAAQSYFAAKIFPALTPLAVDLSHPFPFLSNLSLSLGLRLKHPKEDVSYFARVKLPDTLPQWFVVDRPQEPAGYFLLPLSELILHNLEKLFPKMDVEECLFFRTTRSVEVDIAQDDHNDYLDLVEEELRRRRHGDIVRLEYSHEANTHTLGLFKKELTLHEDDIYKIPGPLNYKSFEDLRKFGIKHLQYPAWVPKSLRVPLGSMFQSMRERDLLVHHPYESFSSSVEKLLQEAARDEKVISIRISIYRVGAQNPLIALLIEAAEQGKQVVCVLELKARGDEAHNIYLGEMLEKAGIHVVYGVLEKKTHAKSLLVVRQVASGQYELYCHVGTGNYNHVTTKSYTDLGLFTCDPRITNEVLAFFNSLTGLSRKSQYKHLMVSPVNMQKTFFELIKFEIKQAKKGNPAHIIAKMNNLECAKTCEWLYKASKAGVVVQLIVRGFCVLRPAVEGLSENIVVTSILGQFLEHSRLYVFLHGGASLPEARYFMGSADWRPRNFQKRIELCVPIFSASIRQRLSEQLKILLKAPGAWVLDGTGEWKQNGEAKDNAQQRLMRLYGAWARRKV